MYNVLGRHKHYVINRIALNGANMNNLQVAGILLNASMEERTLTYKLLPFGEEGSTNVGKVIASKGSITLPEDVNVLELNEEHDYKNQIGKFVSVVETDTHLEATVRIVATTAGNDALTLASEGLRTGISVEIANPIIRAGKLISGNLTGAGLVVRPAFKNAQLIAADCGDLNDKDSIMDEKNLEATEVAPTVQAAPIVASNSKVELGALSFEALKEGGADKLNAALADQLTTSDAGKFYIRDQEVGEVWEARKAARPVVSSLTNKSLTSLTVAGNKKNRTFEVSLWNGNKTEIPSSTFTTELITANAKMLAGAVDVAGELVWFGSADIMADLYEQAVESYAVKSEAQVVTQISAEATAVSGAMGVIAAVDYASQALAGMGAQLSFITVSPDVYSALINITATNAPWWLAGQASVNLASSTVSGAGVSFTVNPALPANTVLVGDSRAATVYESKDIRLNAVNLPQGGYDLAFIKAFAVLVTDPRSILKFTNVSGA